MISQSKEVPMIVFSVKFYEWLLVAYPARFRKEYGSQMVEVFRDCCLRAFRQGGMNGMTSLWAVTLLDLIRSLITEYLHKETSMTSPKFIRLSGRALMTGAAVFLPYLADVMLWETRYDLVRNGWYRLDFIADFGLLYGSILLPIGMLGLRARYGEQMGELGRGILLAGALGGGTLVLSWLYGMKYWSEHFYLLRGILVTGLSLQFLSLLLFGALALVRKPLPRSNGLPLLAAGLALPIFLKLYGMMVVVPFLVENLYFVLPSLIGVIIMTIALIRLGYILQAPEPYEVAEIQSE
jgi:hypothetical protein